MAFEMDASNPNLQVASAFPRLLRDDVLLAASVLPEPFHLAATSFRAAVGGEVVTIPCRVYYDPGLINLDSLTSLQQIIVSCVLTRHHDGFVRERHLARIISCQESWIPPFVVQLVGEYVVEILQAIHDSRAALDSELYGAFLEGNAAFWARTKQRVVSYWDCYYRSTWARRDDYVGFQLIDYLDAFLVARN